VIAIHSSIAYRISVRSSFPFVHVIGARGE